MHPGDYWRSTPRQITASISAANRRIVREMNQQLIAAWKNAYFSRVKKMPKLASVMMRAPSRRRQTWQEQLAIMDMWMSATKPKQVN